MSYEPTNWKTGDVVTSAKLNKLENGVANASWGAGKTAFIITITYDSEYNITNVDRTWQEIRKALDNYNIAVYIKEVYVDKTFEIPVKWYVMDVTSDKSGTFMCIDEKYEWDYEESQYRPGYYYLVEKADGYLINDSGISLTTLKSQAYKATVE